MNTPSYLWRNKYGTYYFRVRIPLQLCQHFNSSEFKRSLKTDSRRLAIRLARIYRAEFDSTVDNLMNESSEKVRLITHVDLLGNSITFDTGNNDEDFRLCNSMVSAQQSLISEQSERRAEELHQAQLAAIATAPAVIIPSPEPQPSPLYSEIIEVYLDEGEKDGRWTSKSKGQVESSLKLFQEFVGDLPIASIDKKITRGFKAQYLSIPSNQNKKPQYRDKTIVELLGIEIPKEDLIDSGTVLSNMTRIGGFFNWAKDHDYILINPIEGVKPRKAKRKKSDERNVFTNDDLVKIFESSEYKNGFLHGSNLWKYWIPIVALYTAMRLEEVCRLRVECFSVVDGIDVVEIKPDGEWLGKTDAALRSFAVHPKLKELGLLKLVEQQRLAGQSRLFDELLKGRDGYGARVSKWFARYCDRLGIIEDGKVFHSLRHTLLNELKQKGVVLEVREAIAGHENDSQSSNRYGKAYLAEVTLAAIEKADFGLNHPLLKR